MPVTTMEKLTALCLQSDAERLLRTLAEASVVEILTANETDENDTLLPLLSADSAAAMAAADRIDRLLPVFASRAPRHTRHTRTKIPVDVQEFSRSGTRERAMKTADEAERLLTHIAELTAKMENEQAEMAALLPYVSHAFALDDPGTRTTTFLLGALPAEAAGAALDAAAAETGFVFEILSTDKSSAYVAVIAHRAMQEDVLAALTALGFTPAVWRSNAGRAGTLFDAASARASALNEDIARANAQLDSLSDNLTDLKILSDILHTEARLAAYREKMQQLGGCAVLSGWCPAHEHDRVAALLDTFDAAYSFTPPAEGEKTPVLAETPPARGVLAPVLNAYTYPTLCGRNTVWPLQILFFLFFGLLFADVGYGVLTALIFFPIAIFLAMEEQSMRAFFTLGCIGLGAIPFGILTGNIFGPALFLPKGAATLAPFPTLALHLNRLRALLVRPRVFLAVALSLAAVILLADLADRLIRLCRAGKSLDALLVLLPELFLFGGIGILPFFPRIGLGVTALALFATAIITAYTAKGFKNQLILFGGVLLARLIRLLELLRAARIALVGSALLPVTRLIALLPLARGEVIIWYLGLLLTFLIAHLLNVALNAAVVLARRARLAYTARYAAHYPARDVLFSPMELTRRYTAALPAYEETESTPLTDGETPTEADEPVAYTTQKL